MLAQCPGGIGKFIGSHGIELEHVVVAWNGDACADIPGQSGGFLTREVSCDTALRAITVNGKKGDVNLKGPEASHHILKEFCVAGVIESPCVGLNDIAEKAVSASVVFFENVMSGWDRSDLEATHGHGAADIEAAGLFGNEAKAI